MSIQWDEQTIAHLRQLWAEGHSTAEIGRRLGISKNSVVGKAHRIDLPTRPSPILRDGRRKEQKPVRVGARRTLPDLPSAGGQVVNIRRPAPAQAAPKVVSEALPAVACFGPPAAPASQPPARKPEPGAPGAGKLSTIRPLSYAGPVRECCWPIGEPGTKSFRFCDEPTMPGRSYCGEHCFKAYVPIRDRREMAV